MSILVASEDTTTMIPAGGIPATGPGIPGLLNDLPYVLRWVIDEWHRTGTWSTVILSTAREALSLVLSVGGNGVGTSPDTSRWTFTSRPDSGWLTARQEEGPTVYIGIADRLKSDPMIAFHPDGRLHTVDTAANLDGWRRKMGSHYYATPGVAGVAAIRQYHRRTAAGRTVLWQLRNPATTEWWAPPAPIDDLRVRLPIRDSAVHRWDMRRAYLAAAAAVRLPAGGAPRPTGAAVLTGPPWAPGYYQLAMTGHGGIIQRLLGAQPGRPVWVGSPTMDLLASYQTRYTILDSWTSELAGRYLRPWAEKINTGINDGTLPWPLRTTLKSAYREAIGLLSVTGGTIYRPDWRHLIIDQARASMLRRIHRVHHLYRVAPVRIDVDSVWYAQTDMAGKTTVAAIGEALGVGNEMGRMRYEVETTR